MEEQALQFVTYYEKQLEIAKRFIKLDVLNRRLFKKINK